MISRWQKALPKPIAFVLSAGAALGAMQTGMLKALRDIGLYPDLIVGASAGALNGSVIANYGLDEGARRLEVMWQYLSREEVFPGGRISRARHLLSHRTSLFPNDRLVELGHRMLEATYYEDLQLPFGALATELLTHHGALFTSGNLHPTLLASAAIPGVFPPVEINGVLYVDGALTAYVPMAAAVRMGAGSLVVLDAGGACHREHPPQHVAEMFLTSMNAAFRQRVRVESVKIADHRPILYLPTLCSASRNLLDFSQSQSLMDDSYATVTSFLQNAPIPEPGAMCGAPHYHDDTPVHSLTQFTES